MKRVNPWQVEIVGNATQLLATFPPPKGLKYPQTRGFLSGDDGEILCPQRGMSSAAAPDPSPYFSPITTFPAGMQGARHYEFGSYNSTGFNGENPPQLCTNNFFSPLPGWGKVSTEMNSGSPPSENLSPNSNTTNLSSGNDLVGNRGPIPAKGKSFQLFGQTIAVQEPSESGHAESGLCEEDGSKESSDNETQLFLTHGPKTG